jgi:hypothetical protein
VSVGTGRAIIKAHWIKNDEDATVPLSAADVQYPRVDAIVLRLDMTARAVTLTAKTGTPAAVPAMPEITRTDEVYELYLASVFVAKNATAPGTITDLRPSTYCGWVTGIVQQVDTSDLFAQWQTAYAQQFAAFDAFIAARQSAFDTWFSNLTKTLNVDTSISQYQNTVDISTSGTWFIRIGIPEYDEITDVLFVYVNGIFFVNGVDYTASGQGIAFISRTLNAGDKVTFVVLHNVIGLQGGGAAAGLTIPQLYGAAADAAGATTIIEEGTA